MPGNDRATLMLIQARRLADVLPLASAQVATGGLSRVLGRHVVLKSRLGYPDLTSRGALKAMHCTSTLSRERPGQRLLRVVNALMRTTAARTTPQKVATKSSALAVSNKVRSA